ncbi:MAG: amino acid permease, partial [Peptostreptococcaceae bacterium]
GSMAIILSGVMLVMYVPGLVMAEWAIAGLWLVLGVIFYIWAKKVFPDFGEGRDLSKEDA